MASKPGTTPSEEYLSKDDLWETYLGALRLLDASLRREQELKETIRALASKPTRELRVKERRFRWLPWPERLVIYVYSYPGGWRRKSGL